ncbi:unnamed protein product, partial [Rotaria magnacalcarata]
DANSSLHGAATILHDVARRPGDATSIPRSAASILRDIARGSGNVARSSGVLLPSQWHPVAENKRIRGWGFTDWVLIRETAETAPKNNLIQQPTELGRYNLLSYNVRLRQAQLLKQYGGYGFIYHVYWFNDHPVMDEALRQMLADSDIDVPYLLCWANEDWFNRWYGGDTRVIFHVNISSETSRRKFFLFLLPFFRDPRYIKVNGKPVFQVYQADTDMDLVFRDFKKWSSEFGFPGVHCHQTLAHFHKTPFNRLDPLKYRIPVSALADGVSEFQPNFIQYWTHEHITTTAQIPRHHPSYHWRGIHVDWDYGPRHHRFSNQRSHPFLFEQHLRLVIEAMRNDILTLSLSPKEQYVTVNAWNEWSEGNAMEPSNFYGRAYLEALEVAVLKRVEHSRVCVLLKSFTLHSPFNAMNKTLRSLETFSANIQWEVLAYSAYQTPEKIDFEKAEAFSNFIIQSLNREKDKWGKPIF